MITISLFDNTLVKFVKKTVDQNEYTTYKIYWK